MFRFFSAPEVGANNFVYFCFIKSRGIGESRSHPTSKGRAIRLGCPRCKTTLRLVTKGIPDDSYDLASAESPWVWIVNKARPCRPKGWPCPSQSKSSSFEGPNANWKNLTLVPGKSFRRAAGRTGSCRPKRALRAKAASSGLFSGF